jgi:hypothetical protein
MGRGTNVGGMGMNVRVGVALEVGDQVGLDVDGEAEERPTAPGLEGSVAWPITRALTGEAASLDTKKPPPATASSAPTPSSATPIRRIVDISLKGRTMISVPCHP